jgi:hypothetical protein
MAQGVGPEFKPQSGKKETNFINNSETIDKLNFRSMIYSSQVQRDLVNKG